MRNAIQSGSVLSFDSYLASVASKATGEVITMVSLLAPKAPAGDNVTETVRPARAR